MSERAKKLMPFVATGVVAVIAAAAIVHFFFDQEDPKNSDGEFKALELPGEYLYLNSVRALAYLAELEGGKAGSVRRVSNEVHSRNAAASAEGLTFGAKSQREDQVESTLAPAAPSYLGVMLRDLLKDEVDGIAIHNLTLQSAQELKRVQEGWLVRITTGRLRAPGYIRPYLIVRHSATAPALFPREGKSQAAKRRSEAMWHRAQVFGHRVGPNPRITLEVKQPPPPKGGSPVRMLLPIEYRDLTSEREMLEGIGHGFTGGRVVVVGEVVDVLRSRNKLGRPLHPKYVDYSTRESWQGPLRHASNSLIKRIGRCRRAGAKASARRRCLLREMRRQTELSQPGVVILPLAIYK